MARVAASPIQQFSRRRGSVISGRWRILGDPRSLRRRCVMSRSTYPMPTAYTHVQRQSDSQGEEDAASEAIHGSHDFGSR